MTNPLTRKTWSPYAAGMGIGLLSWFAFATADMPLGITTTFEQAAALGVKTVAPGTVLDNDYFVDRVKDAPLKIGWEAMLVLGVFLGSLLSSSLSGDRAPNAAREVGRWRFESAAARRLIVAFLGGALMMFGARLAQGCTSGHGISGGMQLAASSWLFLAVFFTASSATAFALYRGKEARDV